MNATLTFPNTLQQLVAQVVDLITLVQAPTSQTAVWVTVLDTPSHQSTMGGPCRD